MPERKTLKEDLFYRGSSANLPRLHTCENKVPFWDFNQFAITISYTTPQKMNVHINIGITQNNFNTFTHCIVSYLMKNLVPQGNIDKSICVLYANLQEMAHSIIS